MREAGECVYIVQEDVPDKHGFQYQCAFCGHKRISRHPPHRLHRACPALNSDDGKQRQPGSRERAEATLQSMMSTGVEARGWDAIQATLDRCFGGCNWMKGQAHCELRGSPCQQRQQWLQYILLNECEHAPCKTPAS